MGGPQDAAEKAAVDRAPWISEVLGGFAAGLRYEDIPAAVAERAKYLVLDCVGIALASTTFEFAGKAFEGLFTFGEGPRAVIGMGRRLALVTQYETFGLTKLTGADVRHTEVSHGGVYALVLQRGAQPGSGDLVVPRHGCQLGHRKRLRAPHVSPWHAPAPPNLNHRVQ